VAAFCSPETASALLALSTRTGLVTVAHAPGETSSASIPVTVQDDDVVTVLGSSEGPVGEDQLRDWAAETNETLALVLADAWYVEIFDPVWGRNDVLLTAVFEALQAE
jgi:hypothetical protein